MTSSSKGTFSPFTSKVEGEIMGSWPMDAGTNKKNVHHQSSMGNWNGDTNKVIMLCLSDLERRNTSHVTLFYKPNHEHENVHQVRNDMFANHMSYSVWRLGIGSTTRYHQLISTSQWAQKNMWTMNCRRKS